MSSGMNWKEPETKVKFLLAVLATNDSSATSQSKATQIAQYMGCTAKAVTHQLTALRKDVEALRSGQFASAPGSSNAATGGSGGTPATPKASAAKASAKKRKIDEDDGEGEGDSGVDGTPSKKAKAKTTPKAKSKAQAGATKNAGRGSKKKSEDMEDAMSGVEDDDGISARKDAAEGREAADENGED